VAAAGRERREEMLTQTGTTRLQGRRRRPGGHAPSNTLYSKLHPHADTKNLTEDRSRFSQRGGPDGVT
jgi:hypothetical protein